MTIYDDTHAALDQASAALALAAKTTAGDAGLSAAVNPFLVSAGVGVSTAGVAVDKYVASIPTVMPLLAGLSAEGMSTPSSVVKNRICNAYHFDLEPTQGCPIPANNVIDKALASGQPFRLRLYFGRYSAQWLTNLAGSVIVSDTTGSANPTTASVPRWWTQPVLLAQEAFLKRLAAKYDGKVSLVFLSSPMTIFAEPMQRQIGDQTTRANLVKAGYTYVLDRDAFTTGIMMMKPFVRTRVGLAVTPFQYVTLDGKGHNDATITNQVIDSFRVAFPSGVVQNNSLRTPLLSGEYTTMYDHMTRPLAFQTATEPRVGDYAKSIEWAISRGAHIVELSPGFEKHLTAAQLADFDARLKANV